MAPVAIQAQDQAGFLLLFSLQVFFIMLMYNITKYLTSELT